MPFRRRWNAAKASKEIINILTDDIQKEMERGKDTQRNHYVLTYAIQKAMERGKGEQRNY